MENHIIRERVSSLKDDLIGLSRAIHSRPELGFKEQYACALQVELLRREGFDVTVPFAGIDTAYRATWGSGKPVVCFMAEYDALPGVGHGCGHNLIAPAGIAAGLALRAALEKSGKQATILVMGTPGEEGAGGKVIMTRNGALDGIDVALMAHPANQTAPDCGRSAIVRRRVTFIGQSSHAGSTPHLGKNALDGVMLLFAGINAWRQHLPETCRVHGIVNNGGEAANVVPREASCTFYLRAFDENTIAEMNRRFGAIANGAAMMTDTTAHIEEPSEPYKAGRVNKPLNSEYSDIAKELGMEPQPGERSRASSDFGDVAAQLPAAHFYFGITKQTTPGHSPQFAAAAISDMATERMLLAGQAMAMIGLKFCTDDSFRTRVVDDFKNAI